MTLAEVGLLAKMRWTIWGNGTLPADPTSLARVLGLPEDEVLQNLSGAVLSFFAPAKGFSERLECPELVNQMERLQDRRRLQSQAAQRTNAKRSGNRDAKRIGTRIAPEKNRSEKNGADKSVFAMGSVEDSKNADRRPAYEEAH